MIASDVHTDVSSASSRRSRGSALLGRAGVLMLLATFLLVLTGAPALAQEKAGSGDPPKVKKKKGDKKSGDGKAKKSGDKKSADGKKKKTKDKPGAKNTAKTSITDEELKEFAGGTPKIKAVEPTFDFGSVWAGPDLRHSFTIKNEGDGILEITRVKPACGCTQAGPYKDKLKPGESTDIPFKLKTASLARGAGGKFSKSITVTTNDKKNATTKLLLTGIARYRVAAPSLISFGTVKADVQTSKTIKITNNTDKKLVLTLPDPSKKNPYKYELIEKEPGKLFELKATTVPPMKEGRVSTELVIGTNIKEQKELKLRVSINVPPRIQIRPTTIIYNPKRLTVPVTITNNGLTDVKVLSAEADDPSLKVTVDELKPGKSYTVKVTFPKNYKAPKGGDRKLTIKTDDPERGELIVAIRGAKPTRIRPAQTLVGKPAPSFELKTTDGKTLSNKELKDIPAVVLTFWAADCPYCKKALPRVDSLRKEFEPKGVRFIHVAETMRKRYTDDQLKKVLKDLKVEGELVTDQDNKLGPTFKSTSYPTMVMLGKSGKVEMVIIGNQSKLEADLSKKLRELTGTKKPAVEGSTTATALDPVTGTTLTIPPTTATTDEK